MTAQVQTSRESAPSPVMIWAGVLLVIVAAATSRAMLQPPWELLSAGRLMAWLGFYLSAPALGAAAAVWLGTPIRGQGFLRPSIPALARTAAAISVVVVMAVVVTSLRSGQIAATGQVGRPWGEILGVGALFAAIGAMDAYFWQGLVQRRAMIGWPALVRPLALLVLAALAAAPLLVAGSEAGWQVAELFVVQALLSQLLAATVMELGGSLLSVMATRAALMLPVAWAYQAYF